MHARYGAAVPIVHIAVGVLVVAVVLALGGLTVASGRTDMRLISGKSDAKARPAMTLQRPSDRPYSASHDSLAPDSITVMRPTDRGVVR